MSTFVINAKNRTDEGKGASRRLRREGLVPGIIYGGAKTKKPTSISIPNNELIKDIQDETFFSSILTINLDGKEEKVIIKDMQRHPARQDVLHADFQRVGKTTKIKITVPLSFEGFEASPAAEITAKFAIEKNVIQVICSADKLPEALVVDLSQATPAQIVHLSDIQLPKGVEIEALRRGDDQDQSIGYVYSPRGAIADDEDEADNAAADSAESEGENEE